MPADRYLTSTLWSKDYWQLDVEQDVNQFRELLGTVMPWWSSLAAIQIGLLMKLTGLSFSRCRTEHCQKRHAILVIPIRTVLLHTTTHSIYCTCPRSRSSTLSGSTTPTFRLQSHTIAQSRHNEDPYRLAVVYRPCTFIPNSRISDFPAPSTQDASQKVLFSNPISFRDYLLSTNTSLIYFVSFTFLIEPANILIRSTASQ